MREEMSRTKYYTNEQESDSPWFALFIFFVMCVFAVMVIKEVNKIPVVYWSVTKNECVKVSDGKCSDIDFEKDKYEKIWVE